jgi:hypothetical protein
MWRWQKLHCCRSSPEEAWSAAAPDALPDSLNPLGSGRGGSRRAVLVLECRLGWTPIRRQRRALLEQAIPLRVPPGSGCRRRRRSCEADPRGQRPSRRLCRASPCSGLDPPPVVEELALWSSRCVSTVGESAALSRACVGSSLCSLPVAGASSAKFSHRRAVSPAWAGNHTTTGSMVCCCCGLVSGRIGLHTWRAGFLVWRAAAVGRRPAIAFASRWRAAGAAQVGGPRHASPAGPVPAHARAVPAW